MHDIRRLLTAGLLKNIPRLGQWLDEGEKVVSMLQLDYVKVRVPVPGEVYTKLRRSGINADVSFPALGGLN